MQNLKKFDVTINISLLQDMFIAFCKERHISLPKLFAITSVDQTYEEEKSGKVTIKFTSDVCNDVSLKKIHYKDLIKKFPSIHYFISVLEAPNLLGCPYEKRV